MGKEERSHVVANMLADDAACAHDGAIGAYGEAADHREISRRRESPGQQT